MGDTPAENQSLDALKTLLLAPENDRIRTIEERLDDPMKRAGEISRSLPDAISMSVADSGKIAKVLHPVIDDSLKESVKNNPKALADAIFPALGPGIRKAISATIMGMIQSLNQVLNHSFSIQGIKWRFEAFKTRKPFAEVVLLNTLVFQVEQIFLIHKETGIVLEHVVAKDAFAQDPDLVSGMLTAIQDFVQDSFQTDTGDELDTLRIGSSRSVWIEKGEHALVAAVIRGTPPMDLRTGFRELIDEIHLKAGAALSGFEGDPTPFAIFREPLKDRLVSREKQSEKKTSPLLWVLGALLVLLLAAGGVFLYRNHQVHKAFENYLGRLEAVQGIMPAGFRKISQGAYEIHGLKDPLVEPPPPAATGRTQFRVGFKWQPFHSLAPELVLARAAQTLTPPDTVRLALDGQTLAASGTAGPDWRKRFLSLGPALPGVIGVSADALTTPDLAEQALTQQMFQAYFSRLEAQKGLMPISFRQVGPNRFEIKGLKDPLAQVPDQTLEEKNRFEAALAWQPYYSLDPEFVLARANRLLTPPPGVTLGLSGARLTASGRAGQEWIDKFRTLSPAIPGISHISDKTVINTDREALDHSLAQLKTQRLFFRNNRTTLVGGQEEEINHIQEILDRITRLSDKTRAGLRILIRGHTDASGNEKLNQRLSQNRADAVFSLLTEKGIRPGLLTVTGVGFTMPLAEGDDQAARQTNRAVTFIPVLETQTQGSSQ